jgi:hypothetical protein
VLRESACADLFRNGYTACASSPERRPNSCGRVEVY